MQEPIDAFVLAKLEENALMPAPPAPKLTLLRRAKFDLHGLPPTLDEIKEYLADTSPKAFARLVDRLLASPRYGEKWGRHWLDVARYADSTGLDEDLRLPEAWRYRDYVIDAFNHDLPYDRFITEQLAGDLIPPRNPAQVNVREIVATGFLALGPKPVAQQDKQRMVYDVVDEQIDTLSKAFLGLTVACARCHDHKFNPISTEDYYSLVSILTSTKNFVDIEPKVSQIYFAALVPQKEYQRYQRSQRQIEAKQKLLEVTEEIASADYVRDQLLPRFADYLLAARKVYEEGGDLEEISQQPALDKAILQRWVDYLRPGGEFRPYLESWHRADASTANRVAGEYRSLYENILTRWTQQLMLWKEGMALAAVENEKSPEKPQLVGAESVFSGEDGKARFFSEVSYSRGGDEEPSIKGPFTLSAEERDSVLPEAAVNSLATLRKELNVLKKASSPQPSMACAVTEGERVEQRVLVRGNHKNPGEVVPKEPWRNKRKQSRKRWTFPLRSASKGWESIGKGAPADGGSRVAGRQEGAASLPESSCREAESNPEEIRRDPSASK